MRLIVGTETSARIDSSFCSIRAESDMTIAHHGHAGQKARIVAIVSNDNEGETEEEFLKSFAVEVKNFCSQSATAR
jgi:hypothetical protein